MVVWPTGCSEDAAVVVDTEAPAVANCFGLSVDVELAHNNKTDIFYKYMIPNTVNILFNKVLSNLQVGAPMDGGEGATAWWRLSCVLGRGTLSTILRRQPGRLHSRPIDGRRLHWWHLAP
jgi:hypothetical protein